MSADVLLTAVVLSLLLALAVATQQYLLALTLMGTAVFVLYCPLSLALVMLLIAAIYRQPSPTVPLMLGQTATVEHVAILLTAVLIVARYGYLLRRATAWQWGLALGVSKFFASGFSVVDAFDPLLAILTTVGTIATATILVGVAGWLAEQEGPRLQWLAKVLIATAAIAAVQAIIFQVVGVQSLLLLVPVGQGEAPRLGGVAGNFLPAMLLTGLAVLILAGRVALRRPGVRLLVGSLLVVVLYFTYTRGAYLDYAVVLLLVAATAWRARSRPTAIAGIGVVIGLAISLAVVLDFTAASRFEGVNDLSGSLADRIDLWKAAVHIWLSHPTTGIGAGSFNAALNALYPNMLPGLFYDVFTYPEHQLLGLLAETGIVGLFSYVGSFVLLIHRGIRLTYDSRRSDTARYLTRAALVLACAQLLSEIGGTWMSGTTFLLIPLSVLLLEPLRPRDATEHVQRVPTSERRRGKAQVLT